MCSFWKDLRSIRLLCYGCASDRTVMMWWGTAVRFRNEVSDVRVGQDTWLIHLIGFSTSPPRREGTLGVRPRLPDLTATPDEAPFSHGTIRSGQASIASSNHQSKISP